MWTLKFWDVTNWLRSAASRESAGSALPPRVFAPHCCHNHHRPRGLTATCGSDLTVLQVRHPKWSSVAWCPDAGTAPTHPLGWLWGSRKWTAAQAVGSRPWRDIMGRGEAGYTQRRTRALKYSILSFSIFQKAGLSYCHPITQIKEPKAEGILTLPEFCN